MGRSLSPILRRELENLDKDADSRKSAMKALKSYVKELDSKAIPLFLAQVSEKKEIGLSSGEYTISLYEVLARVHGPKIVPQIDNIMSTIIKTLTASAGSFPLHQACSKVVPAIARYGMDPTTPEEKKRHIIHSLTKPLSDCLLGSHESLSSGAALCLKALVDSDNWRFASSDMVNEVCQRVAGALEKHAQTNSHMALVMALAKHNSLVVEAYARLLVQSGLQMLKAGSAESTSQKRLSAIHMVNSLMRCLDPKSIFSELEFIIEEMEKCQSDKMPYVRGAAFEALQTAKRILSDKGTKFERDVDSITGSNFDTEETVTRNLFGSGDQSPLCASPESQTINSFFGNDSIFDSPISVNQGWQGQGLDRRSVNRKLWRRCENGGVDVSLKDGISAELSHRSTLQSSATDVISNGDCIHGFAGFQQEVASQWTTRSATPSPQKSRSHVNLDNVRIFTTPRKLIRSLQDPKEESPDVSKEHTRNFRSPSSIKCENSLASNYKQFGICTCVKRGSSRDEDLTSSDKLQSSESVPSTQDANLDLLISQEVVLPSQIPESAKVHHNQHGYARFICSLFFVLLAVLLYFVLIHDRETVHNLVPT